MKDRPILFSAPMVRAILAGTKTQTRRVVKPQPPAGHGWAGWCVHSTCRADEGKATWAAGASPHLNNAHRVACPYGQPGDRLWVRETHLIVGGADSKNPRVVYAATNDGPDAWLSPVWRPSIHMPRWASRITLEITSVRVERLQEISEADAQSEGIGKTAHGFWSLYGQHETDGTYSPRASFRALWQSINGPESWDANPWVWAITFNRIERSTT